MVGYGRLEPFRILAGARAEAAADRGMDCKDQA
jgi:hypothetical protein